MRNAIIWTELRPERLATFPTGGKALVDCGGQQTWPGDFPGQFYLPKTPQWPADTSIPVKEFRK